VLAFLGVIIFLVYEKRFAPIEVKGVRVIRQDIEATVAGTSTGIVRSETEVNVTAQREGKITALNHDEGDVIKSGDIIARLDASEVLANLKKAEAELRQAEVNLLNIDTEYKRKEALYREQLISKQQFDDISTRLLLAKTMVDNVRASLDVAKLKYEYSFIRAPISGIVTTRVVKIGDTVMPGQKIASIVNLSSLYISAPIDEADVSMVSLGQDVRVMMDAYPDRVFMGKVTRISPIVTGARLETKTFEVRVSVPRDGIIIKPGMSADIEIITRRVSNVLVVPSQAVIEKGHEHLVYVASDGRARLKRVETGLFNWNLTEIKSGLSEGEVVIFPPDKPEFKEGVRIRVVD